MSSRKRKAPSSSDDENVVEIGGCRMVNANKRAKVVLPGIGDEAGDPKKAYRPPLKGHPTKSDKRLQEEREGRGAPVRLYLDGIFDLFHYGHARALEKAKKLFPRVELVVGCCNDEQTHRIKGKTVMNEAQRYESLRHCRWVDEVIVDAPWSTTLEFLREHRIDYVVHGEDDVHDAEGNDPYAWLKEAGMFITYPRTDGVSTSGLILTIVRDYDEYVLRNLKRGFTPSQLNVGPVKEAQFAVQKVLNAGGRLLDSVDTAVESVAVPKLLRDSFGPIGDFLSRFDRGWRNWIAGDDGEEDDE